MRKPVLAAGVLFFSICQAIAAQSNVNYYTITGTYTKEEIAQMVQSGIAKNNTRVWEKDMTVWAAAKTI
jgi:hypothetical protein